MMSQAVTLLGSTGSIGTQTLELIRAFPERFSVRALSAGNNLELLARQIREFAPAAVCIADQDRMEELRALAPDFTGEILAGDAGLTQLAADGDSDTLVVGLVGMRGLAPTLKALESGKRVLTANKETFVAGGHLVAPHLDRIIPIDSEHCAIHQCLKAEDSRAVRTLYLTASGGPFRTHSTEELRHVTRAQALKHPNWDMGAKITVDSATMMNKGLEVIEAHWLFGVDYDQIQILVHPQSIMHSGVEFTDGSVLMQMGTPDMRGPIQYALTYPERLESPFPQTRLNLLELSRLEIEPPDPVRFPCIRLAYEAGRLGSGATAVLNAADEEAVALFLEDRIGFTQIPQLIEGTLERFKQEQGTHRHPDLEGIITLDGWARKTLHEQRMSLA